jgi:hypothetical protein
VDFHRSVVTDKAQFPEFVHEVADAGSCRSDHLGQRLLADLRDERLGSACLAEIRQEKKSPRQTLLARIEELIDEILFDPDRAHQEMGKKHLGETGLIMEDANDGPFLDPHDLAVDQRRRARDALRLSGQTSFAAKFVPPEDCDHSLLAVFGNDGDLDFARLDVKDRICGIPLREDFLILAIFRNRSSSLNFGQEGFRIKRRGFACQKKLSRLGDAQRAAGAYVSFPLVSPIVNALRDGVGNEDDGFGGELTSYMYVLGR